MHKRFLLVACSFLIMSLSFAAESIKKNSLKDFSSLETKISKANLELRISKAELERLNIQEQIRKMSGVNIVQDNLNIALLGITIFDDIRVAEIEVNGRTKNYNHGDILGETIIIKQINQHSIEIFDQKKQQSKMLFVIADNRS